VEARIVAEEREIELFWGNTSWRTGDFLEMSIRGMGIGSCSSMEAWTWKHIGKWTFGRVEFRNVLKARDLAFPEYLEMSLNTSISGSSRSYQPHEYTSNNTKTWKCL
jgi:hypothetical protein